MQVDLDQLREVLSLQGSPLDATTLLGVCNSLGFNFETSLDSYDLTSFPSAIWNRGESPSDSLPQVPSMLDRHMLPKVALKISGSECLLLATLPLPTFLHFALAY